MDDTNYVKSGELGGRQEMPRLQYDSEKGSEIGYRTDEEALYIGTKSGNKRLCGVNDAGNINARLDALNALIADITSQTSSINAQIINITARLGALETPSE